MEEKLKKVMSDVLEISTDQIDGSTAMESIESWDSLKHIALMMSIEEIFTVKLETDEMIKMTSLNDIKIILGNKGINFN